MKKKHKEQFMTGSQSMVSLAAVALSQLTTKSLFFVSICCHVWLFRLFKEAQEVSGHLFWRHPC